MSIDIDLSINTGHEMTHVVAVGNYTHNCQRMWTHALEQTGATIPHLCAFDGLLASEALPMLERAIAHMDDPAFASVYEAMNPENGWGNFETAREYLRTFMIACRDHPACTIGTDC